MQQQKAEKKVIDSKQGLLKAEHFCAYQERSQQEVRDKLYDWGLRSTEVEEIIAELIQNNFLNEERFAIAYCTGKFRMKNWGRIKIKQGLKLKRIPDKLISKALTHIDSTEYRASLQKIIEKKGVLLNEKDEYKRRYKLIQYAAGKGYEKDLIIDILTDNDLG